MLCILTPTYNRAYILNKLFNSLIIQTCKDFEWLVIDDGSTDNTRSLILEFQKKNNGFPIRYFYKANGGKCNAINYGVRFIKEEYIFLVDSDDYISDNAVELIKVWIEELSNVEKETIVAINALRSHPNGKIIGQQPLFKKDSYVDCSNIERSKYGLLGDKAVIFSTAILKKYHFPQFKHENFLAEDAVLNALARDGYKTRFYNQIIYYSQYLPDGLTYAVNKQKLLIANFIGTTYVYRLNIHVYKNIMYRSELFYNYYKLAIQKKYSFGKICKLLNIPIIFGYIYQTLFKLIECYNTIFNIF